MNDIIFWGLVLFCAVALIGWHLAWVEAREAKRQCSMWRRESGRMSVNWKQCQTDLGAAEKKIAALGRQVPGRDKSGRFVKQRDQLAHGSE
ncbi:hypothetical protein EON80_12985 [bacterium]|nr:MAG: hypothetical protein EON80_12985 [bacterium]